MLVRNVMNKKGNIQFTVSPGDTILTVLKMFHEKKIGFVIITDTSNKVVGTVSERDMCEAMGEGATRDTAIEKIMNSNIVSCNMDDNLPRVAAIMTGQRTRHVLVYDDNVLEGIISIGDVVKHRLDETLHEEEEMRNYIVGTGYSYGN